MYWFMILLLAVIMCFIGMKFAERTVRRNRLQGRLSLSDEAIYSEFYASSGIPQDALLKAWHLVASLLHCDAGKLRPQDSLTDLAIWPKKIGTDFSDIDDISFEVNSPLNRNSNSELLNTIDDVVRHISGRFL